MESRLVGHGMAKLPPKPAKVTKCLEYNMDVCPRLFPMTPREMSHFDLAYAHAKLCRLGKNFGVNHRADAPDLDVVED
jgi:hypothetical protein